MDAEQLANAEGFAEIERLKAAAQSEADDLSRQLRAKLAEMEMGGNRHQRRKAKIAWRRIKAFEAWYQSRLDRLFDSMMGGFDPESGTLSAVQKEASDRLAAIFN